LHSFLHGIKAERFMTTHKFWPLDMDPEGQIYDNPAWDLPGFRRRPPAQKKSTKCPAREIAPVSCV
jgi:hypothetical protein